MTAPGAGGQAVDLRRFNQVFFEECAEHLAEMEHILLSLAGREPEQEELNAIFRAAHSIKGGAGIFGFEDMTVVTHVMESLLDRLRNRETLFEPGMIDLFLEAGDVIGMQLAGHREGKEVRQEAVDRVRARLQQVIDGALPHHAKAAREETSSGSAGAVRHYRLAFSADPDIFHRGVRMDAIIGELASLAEERSFRCRAELTETPELLEFDPERCITRWHFTLSSRATPEEILDVFIFVADAEQLALQELADPAAAPAERTEPAGEPRVKPALPGAGETQESRAVTRGEGESSIRVSVARVDQLVNQVGELLITQAMLAQTAASLDPILHEVLQKTVAQLERNTRDLQQSVMSIRLVPIGIVFNRFPRMVRDLAAKLGKSVELKTSGDSTELDKGLIEKIADPLSHLVRNALDHGIETTEARAAKGKPPTGTLQLRAAQTGGRIVIDVIDDGAGLDRDRILAKAAQREIPCSEAMSDEEVWQLIFAPGFSTADTVTDISGRGVGMDVVIRNVQAIGGRVQVASSAGQGARITISLPLTLAIQEGLSVAVGSEKFVIPISAIVESLQPQPDQLKSVNGMEVVVVRGDYLPIVRLHRLFGIAGAVTAPERAILVLLDVEGARVALLVDDLLDGQQVVVKSIETNFRKIEGSAGATVLGDGRVALILDVNELLTMSLRQARAHEGSPSRGASAELTTEREQCKQHAA